MPRLRADFSQETLDWSAEYKRAGVSNEIPVMDIEDRLRTVERRLLIVDPPKEVLSRYPALQEAFREYKLIERLTLGTEYETNK